MAGRGYESRPSGKKRKGKVVATPSMSRPESAPLETGSNTPTVAAATPETGTSGAVGSSYGHTSPLPTTFNYEAGSRSADGRLCIKPVGNTSFFPRLPTVNYISGIYKSHFLEPWTNFSSVPEEVKEQWWNQFKTECTWRPEYNDRIRKIWENKCSSSIRSCFSAIREGKTSGNWLGKDIKEQFWEIWAQEDFKVQSERNKLNRSQDQGAAIHRGGSMSVSDHTRKLAKELGRDPDASEVFFRMQYNKSKGWKSFEDLKVNTQDSISSPIDNNHLWIEAVGGKKKGRIYGLGSQASVVHVAESSHTPQVSQDEPEMLNIMKDLEERFQLKQTKLEQELEERFQLKQTKLQQDLEESQQKQNRMEQELHMLKQLISGMAHSTPPPPPPQSP